jgi:hypothetical protein
VPQLRLDWKSSAFARPDMPQGTILLTERGSFCATRDVSATALCGKRQADVFM